MIYHNRYIAIGRAFTSFTLFLVARCPLIFIIMIYHNTVRVIYMRRIFIRDESGQEHGVILL